MSKGDAASNPLSVPVERGQRVSDLPHDYRTAPWCCSHFPPFVAAQKIDESGHRRHVAVVDQESPTDTKARGEMPPVENRIRESMSSVDQSEVEGPMRERRKHFMRRADAKRDPLRRDLPPFALVHDALLLPLVRRDYLMIRPRSGKDDRARARPCLQGVEPGLELPFKPVQRFPLEAPALIASGVKPRWRPPKISR